MYLARKHFKINLSIFVLSFLHSCFFETGVLICRLCSLAEQMRRKLKPKTFFGIGSWQKFGIEPFSLSK
jgi:hypothetical protein